MSWIQVIMDVVVGNLYDILYKLFTTELLNVSIGYSFNDRNLDKMTTLIHVIDLIEHGNLPSKDIIKLIEYYNGI